MAGISSTSCEWSCSRRLRSDCSSSLAICSLVDVGSWLKKLFTFVKILLMLGSSLASAIAGSAAISDQDLTVRQLPADELKIGGDVFAKSRELLSSNGLTKNLSIDGASVARDQRHFLG